jgi:chromosome segregation ATPase
MFEDVRQAFHDLLHGKVPPGGRRELLGVMKETIVQARMALDDLREGVAATQRRVDAERRELDTIRRRKGLAQGVSDAETVTVAERFEAQHTERLAVLERKLAVQQAELELVEREVEEMKAQYKAAAAGVGSGMAAGATDPAALDPLDEGRAALEEQLGDLERKSRRSDAAAAAEAQLAELKRRMGM